MKYLLTLLFLPCLFLGCGYTPTALGPGIGVNTLFIEPMLNRTAEPFLDSLATNSLIERFARDRRITVVKLRQDAEAILSGSVSAYSRSAVSYDQDDNISEYRSIMTISAILRRVSDDKILWKGDTSWTDESLNSDDRTVQDDNESVAIRNIAERVADQLYHRLQESF